MKGKTKKINRWDNLIKKLSNDFNDGELIDLEGVIYLIGIQELGFFDKKFNLIDDSDSVIDNFKGFIQNRHDQSVFSLLCKKYSIKSLSAYECDWGEKNNKRSWDHNFDNPILAKRDLKYNIFRRFINF